MKYLDKVLLLIEEIKARNSQRKNWQGMKWKTWKKLRNLVNIFATPTIIRMMIPF